MRDLLLQTLARCFLPVLFASMLVALGTRAQAEDIDVAALQGSQSVTLQARIYLDHSERATFEQVSEETFAHNFTISDEEISRGMERKPLWLTFRATNNGNQHKTWLLDLSYPHLDYVSLYVVRPNGVVQRIHTGDMLPFAQRPIAQPNFLFSMESEPHETVSVFLRVMTGGTLSVPLHAWSVPAYLEHQGQADFALWMFFGSLMMMALYNMAVFVLIRQSEYLTQALLLVAMCAAIFTFTGRLFQHVLPNHPGIANKAIAFFVELALSSCVLTCSQVVARVDGYRMYERWFKAASWFALLGALLVVVVPKEIGLRISMTMAMIYVLGGLCVLAVLSRNQHPQLRLYVLSWYFPVLGVPITLLASFGVLPPWRPFLWAAHFGCAMQAVFTSLALAARVKLLGDHLAGLNVKLSSNVVSLEAALENARHANHEAQRATRAKDEFLATMSHELRTPLNAIINVPQGLLESFVDRRIATCSHCDTEFTLETSEQVNSTTRCAECQAVGNLVVADDVEYVGDAKQTARFLRKIERAGHHLLHLVDGVLDFSKIEAGRLTLHWAEVDLSALLSDVVDAMSEPARLKGLAISLTMPDAPLLRNADPIRLKQVLLNLLSNAIKFTESQGTITISVSFDESTEADIIRVHDQGIGIAPEHHERIFAGFEQVHSGSNRKYGGTGLGLPISRNLVRLHGGELRVESALGQGSTFVLSLPRHKPQEPDSTSEAPRNQASLH
jgi:two-component system, sensor histidine kinase LadS